MASDAKQTRTGRRNRLRPVIWGTAAALLLLPLVAMQFTSEVDWTFSDFIVMGALLGIVGGLYEVATRLSDSTAYRAGAGVAVVTGFLIVWVNLAVGMLGSEHNPANLLFGGVLLVAMIGALVGRFRPDGMMRAMQAAAVAQAAMVAYALVAGYAEVAPHIGFFILPWLFSAWLFKQAAREQLASGAAARATRQDT